MGLAAEQHVDWVADFITRMAAAGAQSVEATEGPRTPGVNSAM